MREQCVPNIFVVCKAGRPRHDFMCVPATGLEKNGYDKSKCQQAFDEYVDCKRREVGVAVPPSCIVSA